MGGQQGHGPRTPIPVQSGGSPRSCSWDMHASRYHVNNFRPVEADAGKASKQASSEIWDGPRMGWGNAPGEEPTG